MDSRLLEIGKPFPSSYLCFFEDANEVVCVRLDVLVAFPRSRCFSVNWIRHDVFLRRVLGIYIHTQLIPPFLHQVYIIDKTENNPLRVNNHPAWASEYTLSTNTIRAMDVRTNTFCAGGGSLGDGGWISVGGTSPMTTGGNETGSDEPPYFDYDGGFS